MTRERVSRLGNGHFGEVWLEHDIVINEPRAVKYVNAEHLAPDLESWSREARAMTEGEGEAHIVRIYSAEITPSGPEIVMEYLPGGSVEGRWGGFPIPIGNVLDIGIQACRGVEHLHAAGILHRDIKPGNLLLDSDDSVKVSDFGLARPAGATLDHSTFSYVRHQAPELQNAGAVEDEASDVYSMGVTLYRMVNGESALPDVDFDGILTGTRNGTYPDRSKWEIHIPRKLRKVISTAIHVDRDRRYPTMRELRLALEQARPSVAWSPGSRRDGVLAWRGTSITGDASWEVRVTDKARGGATVDVLKGRTGQPLRRITKASRSCASRTQALIEAEGTLEDVATGRLA